MTFKESVIKERKTNSRDTVKIIGNPEFQLVPLTILKIFDVKVLRKCYSRLIFLFFLFCIIHCSLCLAFNSYIYKVMIDMRVIEIYHRLILNIPDCTAWTQH